MNTTTDNKNAHPTKKGPGRKHGHKVAHGKKPNTAASAGRGFVQHHADPHKVARRKGIALIGRRQYLKQSKLVSHALAAA